MRRIFELDSKNDFRLPEKSRLKAGHFLILIWNNIHAKNHTRRTVFGVGITQFR